MSLRFKIAIMMALLIYNSWAQTVRNEDSFSGSCMGLTVQETIEYLSNITGISFAYTSLSIDKNARVHFKFENTDLSGLLEILYRNTGLKSSIFGNQILLRKENFKPEVYVITGTILEQDSITPISYATVSIFEKQNGSISDIYGKFELELTDKNLEDTLTFSSMGYEPGKIPVKDYVYDHTETVVLYHVSFEISPVWVSSRDFKKITLGNKRNIPNGSLYMDTNGQQAALLIENERNVEGRILSLNYYLSSKGNTDAPFRVRLYSVDSATGGPGSDLIRDLIVVKPDVRRGWYSVDMRKYELKMPENGFYIAMEGIYPNDYDFYVGDNDFLDLSGGKKVIDDDIPVSITYGQRLGFTRNKKDKNNTWHYSLSHTWFQLKKQNFGIMVSADIRFRKNKDKKEEK